MKKSFFLSFICACIPGFGQMYYGYMKRGISLLLWFIAIPVVAAILEIVFMNWGIFFAFFMIAVWAYAFFDTFNIRNMTSEQRANFKDESLPNSEWLKGLFGKKNFAEKTGAKVVGWILIVFGVMGLYSTMTSMLRDLFVNVIGVDYSHFVSAQSVLSRIITLAIAVAVVIAGVKILRVNKIFSKKEDDAPVFNDAASAAYASSQTTAQKSVNENETALSGNVTEKVSQEDIIVEQKGDE